MGGGHTPEVPPLNPPLKYTQFWRGRNEVLPRGVNVEFIPQRVKDPEGYKANIHPKG